MVMEILHQGFMLIKFSNFSKLFFSWEILLFLPIKFIFWRKHIKQNFQWNFFFQLFIGTIFFNFLIITCYKLKMEVK